MVRTNAVRLYSVEAFEPVNDFNSKIVQWLNEDIVVREHNPPAAFSPVRIQLDNAIRGLQGPAMRGVCRDQLSNLTNTLLSIDLGEYLQERLSDDQINESGFRTARSQGQAKNNGENFVNAIVYLLANLLSHQDEVLVDKGTPPGLKNTLSFRRVIDLQNSGEAGFNINIECDFAIFSRSNPLNAIVISAKTRLKEVFHVGTMWKLFFDMVSDQHCVSKWNLQDVGDVSRIDYCFATADMIPPGGARTQGPDVERDAPRNLIESPLLS
ncbi:hypothetical protein ACFOLG_07030 [Vogesella facilis]|uniref:Uncharacterized protein n=1 Tax=Vogesella facilis TaxID=1655232 RepID=A0ABV7RET2_9NEIS